MKHPVGRPAQTSEAELQRIAFTLFRKQGFDNTSLTEIARTAGVSRTTLFNYFPTKRDLMWQEHDKREQALTTFFADPPSLPLLSLIREAINVMSDYSIEEHSGLRERLAIVKDSAELRAHTRLRTADLANQIVQFTLNKQSDANPTLIGDLVHALMAISSRAIDAWAEESSPKRPLTEYVTERLEPFITAWQKY